MRHAIWKLTALAGVVGIGLLVVMQAQRGMVRQEGGTTSEQAPGVAGEVDRNAKTADGGAVPKQMEPLGPEGFNEHEPVPASAKTAGANLTSVQNPPATVRTTPPALAGDVDPFEAPQTSPPSANAAQPANSAVALGGAKPTLTDANTFEGESGPEVQPAAVTPIKPRAAAPEREVAMEEPAFEPPTTDGAPARGLPPPPGSEENAAEAAPLRATPAAQLPLKKLPQASPQPGPDIEDEEPLVPNRQPTTPDTKQKFVAPEITDVANDSQQPAENSNGPPPGKVVRSVPTSQLVDDRGSAEGPLPSAQPLPNREPQKFIDDERPPAASPPPAASSSRQPADEADEEFPAPAAASKPRLQSNAALVQPSLVPESQPDVEERPAAALPEKQLVPDRRSSAPLMADDEEQPIPSPSPKLTPALVPDAARAPLNPSATAESEPLVERPALPRNSTPVPVKDDDADEEPFGGRSRRSEGHPRLRSDSPPPSGNPPAPLSEQQPVPAIPSRNDNSSQTPPNRTFIDDQRPLDRNPAPMPQLPAFRDDRPAPGSVPPAAANVRNDAIRLSPAPIETATVFPEQRPLDNRIHDQRMHGTQRPHLTIDKIAPPNAMVGQAMIYHIVVRNAGTTIAQQMVVEDRIPDGLRVTGTIPRAELAGSTLSWRIGALEPGQEQRFSVRAIPLAEGVVGSVATVNFTAEIGARTMVSAPKLRLEIAAPQRATLGAPVVFHYKVTNVGKADSSGVIIRNVLPAALKHADGDDLEYEVGTLPAGQSREVQLALTASQQGRTVNRAVVTADGGLSVQAEAEVEVVGPSLAVRRTGPKRMFPNKPAVFTNTVSNGGSTVVGNITLVETIPPGLDFVSATADGRYDAEKRTVTWRIDRLDARQSGSVDVTLSPTVRGQQVSVVRAFDGTGATGEAMGTTNVTGIAALSVDMSELAAPIVLGESLPCKIRVFNRGSETATNVRVAVTIPPGLQVVSVKGPGNYRRTADQLQFDPIPRLDSRNEATIELTLQAAGAGDARLVVLVQSDQMTQPLRNEQATTIATSQE